MQRTTYYIGLRSPVAANDADTMAERKRTALDTLSDYYDALTVSDTVGMWGGIEEPSLRVELLGEDSPEERAKAREIAATLRDDLQQDAVALTFEPVTFEII